jgi:hypothetical protein
MYVSPYYACRSILLLVMSAGVVWAGPARAPAKAENIVAIADVHGDFDDFVAILQRSGLIDKQNDWTGGKTIFVQVGDLLDRGPKPREVMDLMMKLEKEAGQAGGQVVSLLGNHEMMNVMGDLRYVTPLNYASFANSDSERRRKAAYEEYVKWTASHPALLAELPQPMELTEAMPRWPKLEESSSCTEESIPPWLRQNSMRSMTKSEKKSRRSTPRNSILRTSI